MRVKVILARNLNALEKKMYNSFLKGWQRKSKIKKRWFFGKYYEVEMEKIKKEPFEFDLYTN